MRERLPGARVWPLAVPLVVAAGLLAGGDAALAATTTYTAPGQHSYTVPAGVARVDVV